MLAVLVLAWSISTEESDESDVDEAEGRGESAGETTVDVSESLAVVEVTVRLRAGWLGLADPVAAVVAIVRSS
jgi:hypothetical protein